MGVRFDLTGVANGFAGGVGHREIDLLRAILRHAHDQMRLEGDVAEAFSRTCPSARGVQAVAPIVFGRFIGVGAVVSVTNDGKASEDDGTHG